MMLLAPTALVGLIAAATPVAIYLFLRRRKTEINWGASYLLRLTLASKKRTSLWRQYVVLAVRTLILALAAMLLAQPFLSGFAPSLDTPALPDRAVHRVVLFDNSRSMTVSEGNLTRLDRARLAAAALLRSQRAGDVTDLVPLIPAPDTSIEPVTLEGALSDDAVQHAVASVPIRDGLISLSPAFAAAMMRLSTTPGAASEIYLFSDFPRELESQLKSLDWLAPLARERDVRLAAVRMTGAADFAPPNISIDAVTMGTDTLVAGVPTRLYIDATNHSDRESVATFEISGNSVLRKQAVRFNPDEHKRIPISLSLQPGKGQVLKAAVQPSQLAEHATRSLSVDVKEAFDVWWVADEKEPGASASDEPDDAEFFQRAVKQRKDQASGIRIKPAKMNDLTVPIPDTVDAVILVGPRYTNPAIAAPLADFARRGGGVVLTLGPAIQLPAFNENLAPLLPAVLEKPIREKLDPEVFLQPQIEPAGAGSRAPLFEEFVSVSGNPSDLGQARFYNHFRVRSPETVTGVVARLSNGDPLLIEKRIGRGSVFLFTSTLGVGWTSLPVRQSYIPFVTRILNAAVAGRTLPLNLSPGGSFVTPWPAKGEVKVTLPDQSIQTRAVLDAAAGQFVVLDSLRETGLYQISDSAGNSRAFTVVGAAAESDLRSLPLQSQQKFGSILNSDIHPDWFAAVKTLGPAGANLTLWPWILAAMLVLYVFEAWFVKTL